LRRPVILREGGQTNLQAQHCHYNDLDSCNNALHFGHNYQRPFEHSLVVLISLQVNLVTQNEQDMESLVYRRVTPCQVGLDWSGITNQFIGGIL
jgi:hypothetical protein